MPTGQMTKLGSAFMEEGRPFFYALGSGALGWPVETYRDKAREVGRIERSKAPASMGLPDVRRKASFIRPT